jgi:hypothetical protein
MNVRHRSTHSRVWLTFGAAAAQLLVTRVGASAQQSQLQQQVEKAQTDTKQSGHTGRPGRSRGAALEVSRPTDHGLRRGAERSRPPTVHR